MNEQIDPNPIIEAGEHFVVTRGFELGRRFAPVFSPFGFEPPEKDEKPDYDRSHEGCVYLAVEVAGPVIAARCVAADHGYKQQYVGTTCSLNTNELKVWPVTKQYVEAMTVSQKEATHE